MPIIPAKRTKRKSDPAAALTWQIEQGLQLVVQREWVFHPTRKWRWDIAILSESLAIEIDGGLFLPGGGGRHSRGAGARNDAEKTCEGVILGWRILRVLPEWVASGVAFSLVERAVKSTKS